MAINNYDLKIKKRIQLVHIAANELGLLDPKKHETDPDDEYHLILRRWNRPGTRQPVTSSLQMSHAQLGELLNFLKALGFKIRRGKSRQPAESRGQRGKPYAPCAMRYASSMQGLREELCDLAKARWGVVWAASLTNLCRKFGVDHYMFLDLRHGKAVKQKLMEWGAEGRGTMDETAEEPIPF